MTQLKISQPFFADFRVESSFPIFIYYPGRLIKKLIIRTEMEINSLRRIAFSYYGNDIKKNSSYLFVFAGQTLDEQKTFSDYGISMNDTIVAIPKENSEQSLKWIHMTSDNESFKSKVELMMNKKLSNEMLRLRDLHQMRLENKKKAYNSMKRKVINQFSQEDNESNDYDSFDNLNSYDKKNICSMNDMPNCDPLPVAWSMNEQEAIEN